MDKVKHEKRNEGLILNIRQRNYMWPIKRTLTHTRKICDIEDLKTKQCIIPIINTISRKPRWRGRGVGFSTSQKIKVS